MPARTQQADRAIVVFLIKILNLNLSLECLTPFESLESRHFALDVTQSLILLKLEIKLEVLDPLSFIFTFLRDCFYILFKPDEVIF